MIGKLLWSFVVNMGKPDPPPIAKAKTIYRETRAFAELSNEVLPMVLETDPVKKGNA